MRERKAIGRELAVRYRRAGKKGRGELLDEYMGLTGYRRDYASFVLRNWGRKVYWAGGRVVFVGERVKRKRREVRCWYDERVKRYLVLLWQVLSQPCGKRLRAGLTCLLEKADEFGELEIAMAEREKLASISAATIDRLLREEKRKLRLHGHGSTRPGALLKRAIPIRTGNDWKEDELGFLELDLVSHDGGYARGDYCFTLSAVDIKSGWSEMVAVKNKAQQWVFAGLQQIRSRLPFPLRGIDSDNGSEFINNHLLRYCRQEQIAFTRSRPFHLNDNCHVEERNNMLVRGYAGYSRFDTPQQQSTLNRLYETLHFYVNFFQPQMKLKTKDRDGAKVRKHYDAPLTPYLRVLNSAELTTEQKKTILTIMQQLNPFALKRQIDASQDKLQQLVYLRKKGVAG